MIVSDPSTGLAAALASLATPSQHARLIQLVAPVDGLVVERFHATEAVCAPFRLDVDVLATSAFVDTSALLGQRLSLQLRRADGGQRTWHALCAAVAPLGGDRPDPGLGARTRSSERGALLAVGMAGLRIVRYGRTAASRTLRPRAIFQQKEHAIRARCI